MGRDRGRGRPRQQASPSHQSCIPYRAKPGNQHSNLTTNPSQPCLAHRDLLPPGNKQLSGAAPLQAAWGAGVGSGAGGALQLAQAAVCGCVVHPAQTVQGVTEKAIELGWGLRSMRTLQAVHT